MTVYYFVNSFAVCHIDQIYSVHYYVPAGATFVKPRVRNPTDRTKEHEVKFLVDYEANYSFVPKKILRDLNIKPDGKRDFVLANGVHRKKTWVC